MILKERQNSKTQVLANTPIGKKMEIGLLSYAYYIDSLRRANQLLCFIFQWRKT